MTSSHTLHGVPRCLVHDGWWLEAPDQPAAPLLTIPPDARSGFGAPRLLWGLMILILLADLLFWDHPAGLSVAVFSAAIFGVATLDVPRWALVRPAGLLGLGLLPVLEHVQTLSLGFLGGSLIMALVWARLPASGSWPLACGALRLVRGLPLVGARAIIGGLRGLWPGHAAADGSVLRSALRGWAFPVGGTLVLAALLLQANPVLARVLDLDLDLAALLRRALFWLGTGMLVWPLIDSQAPDSRGIDVLSTRLRLPDIGINVGSTLRALVLFNLLIGLQTGLDLSILVGGADLPAGMSYAAYAHRGAYPLLLTALLAGAFALAARPFLAEHRLLKPLMLLWLAQNVALSLSALLRLELYMEAYGLTYLRVHALIWMGLVAIGLGLIGWQVWRGHSNRWMLIRSAALGALALYLCCFVNFAAIIAERNLARWPGTDLGYVCVLGPTAARAIARAMDQDPRVRSAVMLQPCQMEAPVIRSWQEWGFRNWRVARYPAETRRWERAR